MDTSDLPDRDSANDAELLFAVSEALILGYPILVVIGECDGKEGDPEILSGTLFEELNLEQRKTLIEATIEELRDMA